MSQNKGTFKTSQGTQPPRGRSLSLFLGSARERLQGIVDSTLSRETLENAQLLEAAERRAVQLDTLNQVSRILNQTLELDAVLQLIMEKSLELLDAEAGSLMLADNDAAALTFEVVLSPVRNKLRGEKVAINSSSIVGSVALERQPLIVKDAQTDPRWDTSFDQTLGFIHAT